MPVPHVPWQPSPAQLRRMALAATVRTAPHGAVPAVVGNAPVAANAAGWSPHWAAAAVFVRRWKLAPGRPSVMQAVLVVGAQDPGESRPWWGTAPLCSWPA